MSGAAGLILAGGASRRMPGTSKLSRRWADTTVIGAVVRVARAAGLAPVVVVGPAGGEHPPGAEEADERVRAPAGGGRSDSLAAGLAATPEGPVVVLLGDEPALRPDLVVALVRRCREAGADAGRIRYVDRPGHPVWLGPRARPTAGEVSGDADVWEHVRRGPLRTVVLEVDEPAPIDVDTPEALDRARARATATGADPSARESAGDAE